VENEEASEHTCLQCGATDPCGGGANGASIVEDAQRERTIDRGLDEIQHD
jgi:hypothetical protein